MDLAELRNQRERLLGRLAELSQGSTRAGFLLDELGTEVGLDRIQAKNAFLRLRDDGLVVLAGAGPRIAITHAGLDAVELRIVTPDAPALQVNLMYVERMENSQVQQGTQQSTQTRVDER